MRFTPKQKRTNGAIICIKCAPIHLQHSTNNCKLQPQRATLGIIYKNFRHYNNHEKLTIALTFLARDSRIKIVMQARLRKGRYLFMKVFNANDYMLYDELSANRFTEMSRGGAIAVFVYSPNILVGGERVKYDDGDRSVRTISNDGEIYVPLSFFEKALSAELSIDEDIVTVALGENTYKAKPYMSYSKSYLSLSSVAKALGLCYKTYYSGRLGVIASDADISALDTDEKLAEAGAYCVLGKYDPYSFTASDYKAARTKWKRLLVGSPEMNDKNNPVIREKIDSLSAYAKKLWTSMNRGEDRIILWGEKPPVESEELHRQYNPLATLAKAWGTYGCELYQNEELKADIIEGVKWMYENMYGEAEIEGRGWRDAHLFNWYFWYISAPEFLTNIFFIMEDEFTLEEKRRYLKCFEWCTTFMRYWDGRETALSRICVCTKVGLACEYPERMYAEYVDFDTLLGLEKKIEGPHIDYAQWTHGQPYNTHYGKHNLDRVLHVASVLAGTPCEFTSPKQYNQFEVVKYMFEPVLYRGQSMIAFAGRSTDFKYGPRCGEILADMLKMYGMFGEAEDKYIEEIIKRNADTDIVRTAFINCASISVAPIVDRLLNDNSECAPYEYAHSYFTADRAVQQIKNYAFCISLSSKREPAWESINSANKTGWYTSDGATYLYTEGDREVFDKENFFVANDDIAYSFPGTTEDIRERTPRSIRYNHGWHSPEAFAGSMQIKDRYIVAGMSFASYNFAGPDDHPDDSDSGGSKPVHLNDLVAKKAWFCLEGKIACLGAGITSTMSSPVYTTVDHRRIDKDKAVIVKFGEECVTLTGEYERSFRGPGYIQVDGLAGFVIVDEGEVVIEKYVCEEAGGQSFLKIRISHGVNPTDAGYNYIIMPYATARELDDYMASPTIKTVANNKRVQKVTDSETGLACYIFHEATDFDGVTVDKPCIVTLGNDFLSVCDPTHELESLNVAIWRETIRVTEMPSNIVMTNRRSLTTFTIDIKDACGARQDVKFIPIVNPSYYKVDFTEKEENEYSEMTKDGLVSAFLYSPNVLKDGEILQYKDGDERVRAIARGGVAYVPVSFFSRFLGKDIKETDIEIIKLGDIEYAEAIEGARALGFSADVFYDGRLIAVGREDQLARIRANDDLAEAGAYALFHKYEASVFTKEDYTLAKKKWLERLVGSRELNDLNDEVIVSKIKWCDTKCERALASLNRNPDRVILWGDSAPTESADLTTQYKRIEEMALAFATYGSKYYQDKELLATVIECIEWMYENMYGEAEIAGTGWRSVHIFNWWDWYMGGPDWLTNALLAIDEHLTMEDKERYLKCYKWLRTIMYTEPKSGAASRFTPGTKCALLTEDGPMLEQAQRDFDTMVTYDEYGPMVHKADYVNWTHSCPHNISYGVLNLERGLCVASILAGTPMAFESPKSYNQFNLVKYSFEPSMYRSQGFVMFSGRSTFAIEENFGVSIMSCALPMIGCFGEDEDRYLKSFIKRHALSHPSLVGKVNGRCSIYDYRTFRSIVEDDTIPSDNSAYEYAHAWFTGDRCAQHRNDYAVGIAMSSEREKSWECINSANKTGWHTGDGALYLYTRYDTHQFDGPNFLLNNINIAYRYPGTTEDTRERVVRSIASQWEWYSKNSFAGGLQVDKKYLVASMDFISCSYTGPDIKPVDDGYGGSLPPHENDLVAKKSWFCFDNEIVCLGAGINSTMSSPVHTTVEHRRVVNEDEYRQLVAEEGGITMLPNAEYENVYENPRFVIMEGHTGYLFLENSKVYINSYIHEEADSQRFFEVGIDHGENPENVTYAYALVPYATADTLDRLIASGDIEILSNTAEIQAVRDNSCKVTGYVFHKAGRIDGVEVDKPCILSISESEGVYTLAVTDPTHKSEYVNITLDKEAELLDKSHTVTVAVKGGETKISVRTFMAHGRRYEVKYK